MRRLGERSRSIYFSMSLLSHNPVVRQRPGKGRRRLFQTGTIAAARETPQCSPVLPLPLRTSQLKRCLHCRSLEGSQKTKRGVFFAFITVRSFYRKINNLVSPSDRRLTTSLCSPHHPVTPPTPEVCPPHGNPHKSF